VRQPRLIPQCLQSQDYMAVILLGLGVHTHVMLYLLKDRDTRSYTYTYVMSSGDTSRSAVIVPFIRRFPFGLTQMTQPTRLRGIICTAILFSYPASALWARSDHGHISAGETLATHSHDTAYVLIRGHWVPLQYHMRRMPWNIHCQSLSHHCFVTWSVRPKLSTHVQCTI
jgi:hypothetical protein